MTPQDTEAELSYAYLHAIAAKAGVACQIASRGFDNAGIDATLHLVKDFGAGSVLTEVSLHVQLKATTRNPARENGRLSYFLKDVATYDRLRKESVLPPKFLVVLFLPQNAGEWVHHSEEQLVLQRCA